MRVRPVAVVVVGLPVSVVVARVDGQQVDAGARVDGGCVRAVRREVVEDVVDPRLESRHPVDEQVRPVDLLSNPRSGLPAVAVLTDRYE